MNLPGLAEPPGAPATTERKGLMCNRPTQVALSLRRQGRVERRRRWGWVSPPGGEGGGGMGGVPGR